MQVTLQALRLDQRSVVAGLTMEPEQEAYAGGTVDQVFDTLQTAPAGCHPFALMDDDEAVGFVVVREGPAVPHWVRPGCVSLHNLRVNQHAQGHGYGKAALRLAAQWITGNRKAVTHVMASVNVKNARALKFNLGHGFITTGDIVEGRLGPQIVLIAPVETLGAG